MRALLKNNRQAPRKVRLIARSVIDKNVTVAINELTFMPHKGAETLKKLILSAIANAKYKDANIQDEDLIIKNITVNKGTTFVRFTPRAFGRATPIHKENSHIHVELMHAKTAQLVSKKNVITKIPKEEVKGDKKAEKTDEIKLDTKEKTKKEKKKTVTINPKLKTKNS